MLNQISSTAIGIISILFILAIIIVFVLLNLKRKKKKLIISGIIFLLSLAAAIFLAKPMTILFDKMFVYSGAFIDIFMLAFGNIAIMNTQLNSLNYSAAVQNFTDSEIGISSTIKEFLVKVFNKTSVPNNKVTTLSIIASETFSYILALFIMALILFVIFNILLTLILNLILKRTKFYENDRGNKIVGGVVGFLKGILICILILITASSIPLSIQTDYLRNGFDSTKILSAGYKDIINIEQDLYVESIDINEISSKVYGDYDKLNIGVYKVGTTSDEYSIVITIQTKFILNQTIIKDGSIIDTNEYKFVYANNRLYLFDAETNLLTYVYGYKASSKEINISCTYEIDGQKIKFKQKLVSE